MDRAGAYWQAPDGTLIPKDQFQYIMSTRQTKGSSQTKVGTPPPPPPSPAQSNVVTQTAKCRRTIVISHGKSPKSAEHIDDEQAQGAPNVLTYDQAGNAQRRAASLSNSGLPSQFSQGLERDEYPPAAFLENGGTADVRYVPWLDNRSAGGQLSAGLRGATPGCIITLKTGP